MNELKFKFTELCSYIANGGLALWGAWDWNKVAVITGVALGVGTFFVNSWFTWRRDKREERALEAGLAKRAGP